MTDTDRQQLGAQLRDAYHHVGLYGYAIGEFALIKVCIDYEIFDIIPDDGDIAISELAAKVGGEQEILERFILQLSLAEVLTSPAPGRVGHTHKSRLYKANTLESGLILHVFDMLFRPLAHLPTYFRKHGLASPKDATVTPFGMAMGYPDWTVYDILETDTHLQNQFNRVLKSLGNMYSLKSVYDLSWIPNSLAGNRAAIVDIGGSSGLALKDILTNNPLIPADRCVLYDLPRVVKHTRSTCDDLLKDIQFVGGDVFEPMPEELRAACVYQLRRILNDFTDIDVLRALRTVRDAAAPDSKILVVEEMLSEDRNVLNVGMDIFLMLVGGKKRSTAMFSDLAAQAGLRLNGEFKEASGAYDDYTVLELVVAEKEIKWAVESFGYQPAETFGTSKTQQTHGAITDVDTTRAGTIIAAPLRDASDTPAHVCYAQDHTEAEIVVPSNRLLKLSNADSHAAPTLTKEQPERARRHLTLGVPLSTQQAMVYCGRPAASCARCRARKRRCDKATPACGQCVRIGNVCPGYSDPSVVRIRDETMRIIHRTKATNARRATSGSLSKSGQDHSPSRSTRFFDSSTPTTSSTPGASSLPQDVNSCRDNDCPSEANGTAPFEGQHGGDGKAKGRNAQRMCPAADRAGADSFAAGGHESGGMDLLACYGESQSGRSQARWALSPPSSPRLSVTLSVPASPAAPSTNLGLLGMNYFLANYVLPGSGPCPGSLNYSLDILSDPMEDTELVQEAIRAVGLAGVANTTKADAIMYRARLSYAAALARVNAALADLVMVKSNSPLFAAMMLSIFETITCSSEVALKALRNHIDGMANLLILRGAEQFSTKPGSQLFGEALSHVLILQSRYGVCLSPRLRVLRVAMERQLPQRAPSWHLSTLHIDVMDLYHLVNPDKEAPFLPEEWEKLLSQAVELDQRLEKIFTLVPASWSFKTVHDPASDPRIVYRGIYHVYYNTWVAKVWDGMRACRIILHQAIHCLLRREGQAWAPHELEAERGTYANLLPASWRTTIELRNEILASVPQMLGFIGVDDAMGASQEGTSNGVAASGPYSLLWYLYLVGRLPFNSLETRSWIVDRLRAIRSATGIQKAVYLADTIENYSVLQSRAFSMHEFLIPEESANLIPN